MQNISDRSSGFVDLVVSNIFKMLDFPKIGVLGFVLDFVSYPGVSKDKNKWSGAQGHVPKSRNLENAELAILP